MRLKPDLQLRKIGKHYMVVETDAGNVNMTQVFTMNETAAGLWRRMESEAFTPEGLTGWLCGEYDVTPEQARHDVSALLQRLEEYNLLTDIRDEA